MLDFGKSPLPQRTSNTTAGAKLLPNTTIISKLVRHGSALAFPPLAYFRETVAHALANTGTDDAFQ